MVKLYSPGHTIRWVYLVSSKQGSVERSTNSLVNIPNFYMGSFSQIFCGTACVRMAGHLLCRSPVHFMTGPLVRRPGGGLEDFDLEKHGGCRGARAASAGAATPPGGHARCRGERAVTWCGEKESDHGAVAVAW